MITKADIQNAGAISVRDASDVLPLTSAIVSVDDGGGGHGDQFSIRGGVTDGVLNPSQRPAAVAGENYSMPHGASNTRMP
ncbi:hypothetical protein [Phascolarctobacterium faecium]|uniref:hypothetical protein n=1 Tax=Phascolarctobacterium faecium TaxID=33025 RepID=UPI00351FF25B